MVGREPRAAEQRERRRLARVLGRIDLAAEGIAVVPDDLALARDLEQAPGSAGADQGVAVGQALGSGDEGRVEAVGVGVGPGGLGRAEGLAALAGETALGVEGQDELVDR